MPQRWQSTGRMNTLLELLLNISEMILLKCGNAQTRVGIFSNIDEEQNIPVKKPISIRMDIIGQKG